MILDVVMAENMHNFLLTMFNHHRVEIKNSAHMANNQMGINIGNKVFPIFFRLRPPPRPGLGAA